MNDKNSISTKERIEQCIWKTDTFGNADKNTLKIDSEVATDNDKQELLDLLRTGVIFQKSKSQYILNYRFFQKKIDSFLQEFPSFFPYLPARILANCILLPIEAESQDTALRIFSTLNDRGLPLSDADIFKAQLYKYYSSKGEKDSFIDKWKYLEEVTKLVFKHSSGSSMDELFARYMYYLRAKEGNKSSTTESLRKFYERNKYIYLNQPNTLDDLKSLADFWKKISTQDENYFSKEVIKKLFVLNYAPNGMWQNIASVYFLKNRDDDNTLENKKFCSFLDKITAFILAYAITNPGVNALRTPIYDEMVNIVEGKDVTFARHKFNEGQARTLFENYTFSNQRNATRSMITWYAYHFKEQEVLKLNDSFQIEHIYSRKRQQMERSLTNEDYLEKLGNKILLESNINIAASDYRFEDKKKIYSGEQRRGENQAPSNIYEIGELIELNEFSEQSIIERDRKILDDFFSFLREENLTE